jgi:hypothetical protein
VKSIEAFSLSHPDNPGQITALGFSERLALAFRNAFSSFRQWLFWP